jgi:hypothetical protein
MLAHGEGFIIGPGIHHGTLSGDDCRELLGFMVTGMFHASGTSRPSSRVGSARSRPAAIWSRFTTGTLPTIATTRRAPLALRSGQRAGSRLHRAPGIDPSANVISGVSHGSLHALAQLHRGRSLTAGVPSPKGRWLHADEGSGFRSIE